MIGEVRGARRKRATTAKRMTANSQSKSAEDYVRKVNRLHDIYLERELHHLEDEKRFYLKNFRNEFRLAKEKCGKITSKAKELRKRRVLKGEEFFKERKESEFFITASAESLGDPLETPTVLNN